MPLVDGRVPEAGDIVWVDLGEPVGHEQGGRRPALVVSVVGYNVRSSVFVACPITRSVRPWPFKIELSGSEMTGFVLADQITVIDPAARFVRWVERADELTLTRVRVAIAALMGI